MKFKAILNVIVSAAKVIEVGKAFVSKLVDQDGRVPIKTHYIPEKPKSAKDEELERVAARNRALDKAHCFLEPKGTAVDPGDYRVELEDGRVYFIDGPVFEALFEPADAKRQAEASTE